MDDYTAWTDEGYIEQDLYQWVKSRRVRQRAERVKDKYPRLNTTLYKKSAKGNSNYYTKSPNDYTIKVRMLTRGISLPTNLRLEHIFTGNIQWGPFCPGASKSSQNTTSSSIARNAGPKTQGVSRNSKEEWRNG